MQEYEGWKNYSTWNVALWLENDEWLYRAACDFMRRYKGKAPYVRFIKSLGMEQDRTPDRIKFLSTLLDYKALNELMREFAG